MTTLMIVQKQQDTFKRYDDFIKSIANGRRLAESCGQDIYGGHHPRPKAKGPVRVPHNICLVQVSIMSKQGPSMQELHIDYSIACPVYLGR